MVCFLFFQQMQENAPQKNCSFFAKWKSRRKTKENELVVKLQQQSLCKEIFTEQIVFIYFQWCAIEMNIFATHSPHIYLMNFQGIYWMIWSLPLVFLTSQFYLFILRENHIQVVLFFKNKTMFVLSTGNTLSTKKEDMRSVPAKIFDQQEQVIVAAFIHFRNQSDHPIIKYYKFQLLNMHLVNHSQRMISGEYNMMQIFQKNSA